MKKLIEFSKLPLVNSLLKKPDSETELYDLKIGFDEKTKLVQVIDNAPPPKLFPDDYVYDSSQSVTMCQHFKDASEQIYERFPVLNVLEIGSNSGIFIKNFPGATAVEPCSNFAKITNDRGIKTYDEFWSMDLSEKIIKNHDKMDLIYSANTISHIQGIDDCLKAVHNTLTDDGVFIVECPSFLELLKGNAFDQFYHEHQSYFSLTSFKNLLSLNRFRLFDVELYPVHGGTYRYFICKDTSMTYTTNVDNIIRWKNEEKVFGVDDYDELTNRMTIIKKNIKDIKQLLTELKSDGKKIVGYGASAKFIQVSNMCDLGELIDYVVDTTPYKQNRFTPKSSLKIIPREEANIEEIDYFFLGAWNFKNEIFEKESEFIKKGGKFITHIPYVEVVDK